VGPQEASLLSRAGLSKAPPEPQHHFFTSSSLRGAQLGREEEVKK
jgi:hypothetical protein